ncbi:MAG: hypothetical protein C5B47_08170 [Verrucomicrobia bacterium]|nr:MAG: hypothetical protein C5B47_08170 [Verrucomicrobiota bacterium]
MKDRLKFIILPGWGNDGSGKMWQYQKQHLQELDTEFIIVTDKTTVTEAAEEVLSKAPEQFIVLGHSMGGLIAQHVALMAPQRVKNLILVGTFPGNISPAQRAIFEERMLQPSLKGTISTHLEELNKGAVAPSRANDRVLLESLRACQNLTDAELVNQSKILLSAQDISEKLAAISTPTLILWGRHDQFFPMEVQALMLKHLANAKLAIIEDCGHIPSLEQPQATTSLLSLWLQMTVTN